MRVMNFSHPLTDKHLAALEGLVGAAPDSIQQVAVQFDPTISFVEQTRRLLDGVPISPDEWQRDGWLVVLPSLNYIAAVLLAELHGRMGHFPAILRLRPVANAIVPEFEVAEIINLEQVRQVARTRR